MDNPGDKNAPENGLQKPDQSPVIEAPSALLESAPQAVARLDYAEAQRNFARAFAITRELFADIEQEILGGRFPPLDDPGAMSIDNRLITRLRAAGLEYAVLRLPDVT